MFRPIGEVFKYKKHKLEVVKAEGCCKGCYFENKNCHKDKRRDITGFCSFVPRDDRKDVVFKKV